MTQRNVGAYLAVAPGGLLGATVGAISATSSGDSGDAANIYRGNTIDRLAGSRRYLSAKMAININAILGSSTGGPPASFLVAPTVQDSADGTNWANYATDAPAAAVVTYAGGASASSASSTGTPARGAQYAFTHDVDLSRARRYIRAGASVVVASSSTATFAPGIAALASWVFGGADVVPAT